MIKRLLYIILSCFCTVVVAQDNSCEIKGYEIGFFNGVATTPKEAERGRDHLQSLIENNVADPDYFYEDVQYQLFYNDSHYDEGKKYLLADFAETFDQRTNELDQRIANRWEAFWEMINGRQNSTIIQKIGSFISGFLGFVADFVSSTINHGIKLFLESVATLAGASPNTDEVRMKHNLINDTLTWQGKKLIYIAHSQGNLWVNESYNNVLGQQGYSADNIKVIHIAPASPEVKGDYILSTNDFVINGLQLTGIGSVQPPNVTASSTSDDMAGHGLIEVYLNDKKTKEKIVDAIRSAFKTVEKPEMEDYLYQIEYSYGDDFDAAYEFRDMGFVEPISEEDLASIFMIGVTESLPLASYDKSLTYEWNKENNFVNIIQCDNNGIDNYAFQDLYHIREGIWSGDLIFAFDDTSSSAKIYDRYGNLSDEAIYKIKYLPAAKSRYVNLEFSQKDIYTSDQKNYLMKNKLSGKYILDAKLYYLGSMLID